MKRKLPTVGLEVTIHFLWSLVQFSLKMPMGNLSSCDIYRVSNTNIAYYAWNMAAQWSPLEAPYTIHMSYATSSFFIGFGESYLQANSNSIQTTTLYLLQCIFPFPSSRGYDLRHIFLSLSLSQWQINSKPPDGVLAVPWSPSLLKTR